MKFKKWSQLLSIFMSKILKSKVTKKIETLYTNCWAISAHLELTRYGPLTRMEGEMQVSKHTEAEVYKHKNY